MADNYCGVLHGIVSNSLPRALYVKSISDHETLIWNEDGEEIIRAPIIEVIAEKEKDPNIVCIDLTIKPLKLISNFIICRRGHDEGDYFRVHDRREDLPNAKIMLNPRDILKFFKEARGMIRF